MRVKFLGIAGLSLALALTATASAQQTAPVAAQQAVPSGVQSLVDGYTSGGKLPGLVVAIGRGDAPTNFYYSGRIASDTKAAPADPDSLWRVYSMTKPITGMAAMILIEEGKIKLDQPISDFIPAFKNMRVLDDPAGTDGKTHAASHPITVRNLLTHTAGLGYDLGLTDPAKGSLIEQYRTGGINPAQISRMFEPEMRKVRQPTLEAFADKLATMPLLYEPGTKWSYSIGLDLMGRVIEIASGMSFDAFLQKRIFDPLQMKSTFFTVPQSEVGRFATNYFYQGNIPLPADPAANSVYLSPPSFPYGGAGLVMSARDYDRFLHMLANEGQLDGVRILKPETVRLGMSNLLPAGTDTDKLGEMGVTKGKLGFGAGGSVYLETIPDGPAKGTYGWGGAAGTIAWVDPSRHIRGTLMVNYMPSEHWPLRAELNKAIHTDLAH
jgi:CubicO group peptidase (beta-lactamase class C family)